MAIGSVVKPTDLLVEEESETTTPTRREGRDFHSQQQLEKLRLAPARYRVEPVAAQLTAAVLHELRLFEHTGQLPGGVCWSQQPAWRVELWEVFWQAHQSEAAWPQPQYP